MRWCARRWCTRNSYELHTLPPFSFTRCGICSPRALNTAYNTTLHARPTRPRFHAPHAARSRSSGYFAARGSTSTGIRVTSRPHNVSGSAYQVGVTPGPAGSMHTGSEPTLYMSAQQSCKVTGRRASDGVAEPILTPPSYTAAAPSRATPK